MSSTVHLCLFWCVFGRCVQCGQHTVDVGFWKKGSTAVAVFCTGAELNLEEREVVIVPENCKSVLYGIFKYTGADFLSNQVKCLEVLVETPKKWMTGTKVTEILNPDIESRENKLLVVKYKIGDGPAPAKPYKIFQIFKMTPKADNPKPLQ